MKTLLFFLLLTGNIFSQNYTNDTVFYNVRKGSLLIACSALPHFIAYQTYLSPIPKAPKILYCGVYLTFGLTLDISGVICYYNAYKHKKTIKRRL